MCEVETVQKLDKHGRMQDVRMKRNDVVSTKSVAKSSLFAGSLADRRSVRPEVVFPGKSLDTRWTDGWGTVEPIYAIGSNGEKLGCTFDSSGKGGSSYKVGLKFVQDNLIPSLNANDSIGKDFEMPEEPSWRYDPHPDNWAQRSNVADEILYGMEPAARNLLIVVSSVASFFAASQKSLNL